jgi:enoyl-CoA hydratase
VVPDGHARQRALAIATTVGGNAPEAVKATKRVVRSGLGASLEEACAIEEKVSRQILNGPEAAEGYRAFTQKWPASWRLT